MNLNSMKTKIGTITDACGSLSHDVMAELVSRPFKDSTGTGVIYSCATLRVDTDTEGAQPRWLPEVDYKSALGKVYSKPRTPQQIADVRAEILASYRAACIDAEIHYGKKFPTYFQPTGNTTTDWF